MKPAKSATSLIDALTLGDAAGRWRYLGGGAPDYAVTVNGTWREYPAPAMAAWIEGFNLATDHPATPRPGPPKAIDQVRAVLVDPSLADQIRLAILVAMDEAGLDLTHLAEAAGRTRGGIRPALRFGAARTLSMTMAEQLMTAAGGTWSVAYAGPSDPADQTRQTREPVAPESPRPEPAAVRRMRKAARAHEAGTAEWVYPLDPNLARRATTFRFVRADTIFTVPVARVEPWLTGLTDAASAAPVAPRRRRAASSTKG